MIEYVDMFISQNYCFPSKACCSFTVNEERADITNIDLTGDIPPLPMEEQRTVAEAHHFLIDIKWHSLIRCV